MNLAARMPPASSLLAAPSVGLAGEVRVSGDKTISHRALMIAAMAAGSTDITGLLESEDVLRSAKALIAMGALIFPPDQQGGIWRVMGTGGSFKNPRTTLPMGNSGTTARLLMGVIGGAGIQATLTGDAQLQKQALGRVIKPLALMGVRFDASGGDKLPLRVIGQPRLRGIDYTLPGLSAQVTSAILLAALSAGETTTITEPAPCRDHTERLLQACGITISHEDLADGSRRITLPGKQKLLSPGKLAIAGDTGVAAALAVAATLTRDSQLVLRDVCLNPLRMAVFDTLRDMGATMTIGPVRTCGAEEVADITVTSAPLKGVEVPPQRIPQMLDEIPLIAVAAACADGTTVLKGLSPLRARYDARLTALAQGLAACGVTLETTPDSLTIHGRGTPPAGGATLSAEQDGRLALAFLLLGLASQAPIAVSDCDAVSTAFPDFMAVMTGVGARLSHPVA